MKYVKHRIVFLSHIHMKSADKQTANIIFYILEWNIIDQRKNYSVAFSIYLFFIYLISTPKIEEIHRNKNQNNIIHYKYMNTKIVYNNNI